ncbi:MAG TPA: aromatic ring-opening dioxygenase subunit LigA [Ramlibacter sp.]|uniref:aromatic ring-opening dioxygenase subunit LigA n=1 Tax=Ramlibacter sp. TaxID=1917967 RepID=UPI002CA42D5D|nr:aromatic ring-opening dioxygenase subunit LigA [Ramlibacter sp.]HVZ45737.1 aromatic ring-opening dioxygenase subunit LigA [Ramlibacter sp.]
MTLYALQKAIYEVNRDEAAMNRYRADPKQFAAACDLDCEEADALCGPDIGLLYVLGVNGQLLMHFAAACGYEWDAYIAAMKQGVSEHGPVRAGLYAAKAVQR